MPSAPVSTSWRHATCPCHDPRRDLNGIGLGGWHSGQISQRSEGVGKFGEYFDACLGFGEHELDSQLIGRGSARRRELRGDGDGGDDGPVHSEMWASNEAGSDRDGPGCPGKRVSSVFDEFSEFFAVGVVGRVLTKARESVPGHRTPILDHGLEVPTEHHSNHVALTWLEHRGGLSLVARRCSGDLGDEALDRVSDRLGSVLLQEVACVVEAGGRNLPEGFVPAGDVPR